MRGQRPAALRGASGCLWGKPGAALRLPPAKFPRPFRARGQTQPFVLSQPQDACKGSELACALFYERECQEQTSTLAGRLVFFLAFSPSGLPKTAILRMRPCGPLIVAGAYVRNNTIDLASSVDPLGPRRFVFRPESLLGWVVFANHGSIGDFSPTAISGRARGHMVSLDPRLFKQPG